MVTKPANCIYCKHDSDKHHPEYKYCLEKGCDCPMLVTSKQIGLGDGKKEKDREHSGQ